MELHTTGNILADKVVVLQRLQKYLKIEEEQAQSLIKHKIVLKRDLDANQAHQYSEKLKKLGLDVAIIPSKENNSPDLSKRHTHIKSNTEDKESLNKHSTTPFPVTLHDFEKVFDTPIKRPEVSLSYKIRLTGVALLSLLTPIIYLGLLALTAWGTVSYLIAATSWIKDIQSIVEKVIILTTPSFIGFVLFFFLIKPLFAKQQSDWGFDLKQKDAPALFNLIEIMCKRIGIKPPVSIRIDNNVNAAAGPEKGIISLLQGRMRLYIGLPILAGMSAKQFVGVLAHEFGHFAQPGAMLAYQFINRVNHWLYDRAFTYDSWDERLDRWQESNSGIIVLSVLGAKVMIKLTRYIFKQMYLFNLRMTQGMSRQMEYDADAYESIVCGSDSFKQTSLQLRKLSYAANKVSEINESAWYENKLLRDYAKATQDQLKEFTDHELEQLEEQMHNTETNAWDSHPADTDRIAHVEKRNDSAIFKHEVSAKYFCKDFDNLSERATRYQYIAGKIANVDQYIVDNDEIIKRHSQREASYQSLTEYFAGTYKNNKLLNMNANIQLLPHSNSEWKKDWQQCIDQLRQGLVDYQRLQEKLDENIKTYCIQKIGRNFLEVGIDVDTKEFMLSNENLLLEELSSSIDNQQQQIILTSALYQKRIEYAIQASQITNILDAEQAKALLKNLIFIKELSGLYDIINKQYQFTWIINETVASAPHAGSPLLELQNYLRTTYEYPIWENLSKQWSLSKTLPDMVDKPDENSLLDYISVVSGKSEMSFDQMDTSTIIEKSYQVAEAICYQYTAVFSELVETCLILEKEHGIKPIRLV